MHDSLSDLNDHILVISLIFTARATVRSLAKLPVELHVKAENGAVSADPNTDFRNHVSQPMILNAV